MTAFELLPATTGAAVIPPDAWRPTSCRSTAPINRDAAYMLPPQMPADFNAAAQPETGGEAREHQDGWQAHAHYHSPRPNRPICSFVRTPVMRRRSPV